jgi:hypothetical protein
LPPFFCRALIAIAFSVRSAILKQMNLRRFTTHKRLWLFVSLTLFLIPWFVIPFGKGNEMTPAGLWLVLFQYPDHAYSTALFLLIFIFLFGIPALAIGWVLQCLIVILASSFKKQTRQD